MIQVSVYAVVTCISAFITGFLALYVWKRRSSPGALYFSLLMAIFAHWALFSAIGITADGLPAKVICLQILFAGNAWAPVVWFFFALQYSRIGEGKDLRFLHVLWLVPAIVVVLELTNGWHGLIWSDLQLTTTPFGDTLIREHGPAGWLNAVITYAVMIAGFVILFLAAYRTRKISRKRTAVLVAGAALAMLGNVVSFLGVGLWGYLDMAPLVFPFVGIIFAWGIYDQHIFDLVPVARDTFVRSMGNGLLVLNEEGNLADINPAAQRMLDVPSKPAAMTSGVALAQWPYLAGCWQGPEETSAELRLDGPAGPRWVDARSSFLYNGKGVYQGRVIALWDITGRKQVEEALKEEKARAELYLDLMSHDIRNMNLVGRGYLEQALCVPDNEEKRQEYMLKSIGSIEKSTRLIENVDRMQKVSTGDFRLFAVDAGQVISQVLTQYSSMPGIKAVLRSDVPPDCKVIANDFLYDVFVNLAGNAVKHGGPEIFIDIKAVRATIEGKDYIRFTFEDNGQGIPDDMKEDIFKRLQRGNTAANGKGLGLYLVKTLVDNYKGQVWAENRVASDYTKGSRFVVLLQAA